MKNVYKIYESVSLVLVNKFFLLQGRFFWPVLKISKIFNVFNTKNFL